jgi:hypothetical protein
MTKGNEESASGRKAPKRKAPQRKAAKAKAPEPKPMAPRPKAPEPPRDSPGSERRRIIGLRVAIVALAAVGIGIGVWIGRDDDDNGGEEAVPATSARIVSPDELSSIAASSPTPIYWAGERSDTELELTEEGDNYFLRYLGDGAEPEGDPGAFLTIGTYPLEDPEGAMTAIAGEPKAIVREADDGVEVVSSEENPNSVYFASPDNSVQVEIYDSSPETAMDLALSGEVRPVE